MKLRFINSFLASILILSLFGCGENEPVNRAPKVLLFSVDSDIVQPNEKVLIRFDAIDLEGDAMTEPKWAVTAGTIEPNSSGAIWTAPETEKKCTIEVSVSDALKNITVRSMEIQVWRTRLGNYYPLAVGNRWTYRNQNNNEIIFKVIDRIDIESKNGLIDSFVLEKRDSNLDHSDFSYIGKGVNSETGRDEILQYANSSAPGSSDTVLYEPPLPLYRFPLIPGNKWQQNYKALNQGFQIGGGVDEFEVISEENLTLPAGNFEHVFQVQEKFKWGIGDDELDQTISNKWLAPDVGIVKFSQLQKRIGMVATIEVEYELESYELK